MPENTDDGARRTTLQSRTGPLRRNMPSGGGAVNGARGPTLILVVVGIGVIATVLVLASAVISEGRGQQDQTSHESDQATEAIVRPPDRQPERPKPRCEVLAEKAGREAGMGYWVWCLIDPMTEPQLRALGDELIARMRAARGDHLKAWLYYNRADYDHREDYRMDCAVWLNATGPEHELRIVGPVPRSTTARACYEAYVEANVMVVGQSSLENSWCEFNEATSTLTFHDRWASVLADGLYMEAVVLSLGSSYLPSDCRPDAWTTIPGIERVVLHFYENGSRDPTLTLSYGRDVYEKAVPLSRALWQIRPGIDDRAYKAADRHRALVISDEELRAIQTVTAQQLYALYEQMWVEVSAFVRIERHKPLATPPSDYLRRYFFGR